MSGEGADGGRARARVEFVLGWASSLGVWLFLWAGGLFWWPFDRGWAGVVCFSRREISGWSRWCFTIKRLEGLW